MDVLVRWGQLDSIHVHTDRNSFSFFWTSIHDLILHQILSFSFGSISSSSKSLLPNKINFHKLNFKFNKMKKNPTKNHILKMIEMFIELELNMQAIFNTNFHFHLSSFLSFFNITVIMQNSKINLFNYCCLHISCYCCPDKISYTSCYPIKCFIFFLEVWELEFEIFILSQDACWLQLFW